MEWVVINQPRVFPHKKGYQTAKRVLDIALCFLFLPVALPLLSLLALVVRLDSPGPAFFVQERVGKGGRIFKMYKFRTMQHNLDDSTHRTFMKDYVNGKIGDTQASSDRTDRLHHAFRKVPGSPSFGGNGNGSVYKPFRASQVTQVGRVLRKTSLDELPQLINVIKGEMSVVGPRPNVPWEVEEYKPWHHERLEVLPGITGLAQVRGRSAISFDSIVRYDIEYVEKQSLALDLKILWRTLVAVFRGTAAE
jgi:lipopolysaccharide/colanic/teichoic acid biosynthesis glycosyltransferase